VTGPLSDQRLAQVRILLDCDAGGYTRLIVGELVEEIDRLKTALAKESDTAAMFYKTSRENGALVIAVDDALREAGITYPLGARGVRDLATRRESNRWCAEEAEAETERLRTENVELSAKLAAALKAASAS